MSTLDNQYVLVRTKVERAKNTKYLGKTPREKHKQLKSKQKRKILCFQFCAKGPLITPGGLFTNYCTHDNISRSLYIFYPIFHCGLYCRAVIITDNLCTKQEPSANQSQCSATNKNFYYLSLVERLVEGIIIGNIIQSMTKCLKKTKWSRLLNL